MMAMCVVWASSIKRRPRLNSQSQNAGSSFSRSTSPKQRARRPRIASRSAAVASRIIRLVCPNFHRAMLESAPCRPVFAMNRRQWLSKIAKVRRPESRDLARLLHDQSHHRAEAGQHVNERIGAEQIDSSSQEIADPRLRHVEDLRDLCLLEATRGDHFLELDEQVCTDGKMLRLLARESDVAKDVTSRRCDSNGSSSFHDVVASFTYTSFCMCRQAPGVESDR